jgi:hypothetical protein
MQGACSLPVSDKFSVSDWKYNQCIVDTSLELFVVSGELERPVLWIGDLYLRVLGSEDAGVSGLNGATAVLRGYGADVWLTSLAFVGIDGGFGRALYLEGSRLFASGTNL